METDGIERMAAAWRAWSCPSRGWRSDVAAVLLVWRAIFGTTLLPHFFAPRYRETLRRWRTFWAGEPLPVGRAAIGLS
jgi:hypothetical protein